jgi:hypothetical protein
MAKKTKMYQTIYIDWFDFHYNTTYNVNYLQTLVCFDILNM